MQTFEKHGAGTHFMRPDRVYATGVLAPMAGFAPGQDVQAVVAEFTRRSQNLGGLAGLAGLTAFGAAGQLNFVEKMKLKFEAWTATKFPAFAARAKAKAAARAAVEAAQATARAAQAQGKAAIEAAKAHVASSNAANGGRGPSPQALAHASSVGQSHGQAFHPNPTVMGMAYAQVGTQVAPHMLGQIQMLARLTQGSLPPAVADAQVATTLERWHNMRWNG